MSLESIVLDLRQFTAERNWQEFHNPKNLCLALAGEVGELCEVFQWLDTEQTTLKNISQHKYNCAEDELADVLMYTIRLCDELDIDIETAIRKKMEKNRVKYPIDDCDLK